jgi:hypothetical protein
MFRPQETAAKKHLRSFRILPEWDCHIAALAVSVSRGPASAGFLFIWSWDVLQAVMSADGPVLRESERPSQSLPEYSGHGKRDTTPRCVNETYTT